MAGNLKESPVRQMANLSIGSSSLAFLLRNSERTSGEWPRDFEGISGFIAHHAGVRIPTDLADKLRLWRLEWGIFPSEDSLFATNLLTRAFYCFTSMFNFPLLHISANASALGLTFLPNVL